MRSDPAIDRSTTVRTSRHPKRHTPENPRGDLLLDNVVLTVRRDRGSKRCIKVVRLLRIHAVT
jgi:hypothetical protein